MEEGGIGIEGEETRGGTMKLLCEECKGKAYKYKCPVCGVRSCSLVCVKAHKHRTRCTGKRQHHTQFVPLSKFDDALLFSDYNMLEDVKRVADSARRVSAKFGGNYHSWLPFPLKSLRGAAASRSTKLLFLPNGMSKRVTNHSSYNNRKKSISWTIEWRFHSTNVVIVDHGINENRNLYSVIENHLRPGPWAHPLRQFCEEPLDSLRCFIRKYHKGPESPFRELDLRSPIRQQLANLFILEYPIIHVFLPSHSFDFEITKEEVAHKQVIKESVDFALPSPSGVIFREEEIEDSNLADPQVLDLMKHVNADHASRTTPVKGRPLLAGAAEGCKSMFEKAEVNNSIQPSEFSITDIDLIEDLDFDFEQGLIDAYSDLIAQHNPDDFLDLGDVFSGETANRPDSSAVEEELEEGEIPA